MGGVLKIAGLIILTTLGLAVFTDYSNWDSVSQIAGYPIISIAQVDAKGLVAIGQGNAQGVLVLGQNGWGLVTFAQGGVGLLLGLGQGMAGLIVMGQLAIGVFFALGQLAIAMQAGGQGAFKSRDYFKEMSAEFSELLAYRWANTIGHPPAPKQIVEEQPTDAAHTPRSFGGWPQALKNRLSSAPSAVDIDLGNALIKAEPARIVVLQGGDHTDIEAPDDAVIQLSRSRTLKRGASFLRLLGRDPYTHHLHVELRGTRFGRLRLSAPMSPELLEGLPHLEAEGAAITPQDLLELLASAAIIGVNVAASIPMSSVVEEERVPVRARVRVFNTLKRLIRIPTVLIYAFPAAIIAKFALWITGVPAGDYITVAFVGVVVIFAVLLDILVFLYVFVGPASQRFPDPPVRR